MRLRREGHAELVSPEAEGGEPREPRECPRQRPREGIPLQPEHPQGSKLPPLPRHAPARPLLERSSDRRRARRPQAGGSGPVNLLELALTVLRLVRPAKPGGRVPFMLFPTPVCQAHSQKRRTPTKK